MATTGTPKRSPQRPPASPPRPPGSGNGKGRPAPRRRRNPLWARIKAFFQIVTIFVAVAALTLIGWVFLRLNATPPGIDLPTTSQGITYIYSSDGTPLAEFFRERRKNVPIEDIPKDLQNATVAFEDRRFYTHSGVDYQGIGRAIYSNIRHSDLKGEGGSTITQQLARNLGVEGLTRQKSAGRKFNEMIIASQIEHSYTKQEILEKYLNLINYGSSAYGVEAAAEVYFNKHVKQLNLAQCALLAGLPNRPNEFNPYKDMDAAKGQRNRVLDQMLKERYITPQQHDQAAKSPIKLAAAKAPSQGSQIFHAPYFVNYVVSQIGHKYGMERIYEGNLKIYTTLNWSMQQIAEKEVREGIANAHDLGASQGALVCLDPNTGEIKAMVGGIDYKKTQTNYATHGRQPGSSFKAVVYAAAINDGSVKESTTVMDERTNFGTARNPYIPHDDSGYSDRYVSLREAMAQSINVPAVKVLHLIQPQTAIRYARMMGVKPTTPLDPVLSLALGTSPVSPLEMASVYSTFPAKGNHPEPSAWTRMADADDTVIEDVPPAIATNVLSKDTVAQLDDMLEAVISEGTGRPINGIVPGARGKTGTTQESKDVWFVGYTPDLVCAVWAGHPIEGTPKHPRAQYGLPMENNAFGGTICGPIWAKFMSQALPIFHTAKVKELAREKAKLPPAVKPITKEDTQSAVTSETPTDNGDSSDSNTPHRRHGRNHAAHDNGDGTVTVTVDDSSGLLAPEGSSGSHPETFTTGTEPTTLSPQYNSRSDNGDNSNTNDGSAHTDSKGGSSDNSDSSDSSRSRRHRHRDSEDTVTVTINPEDGLLATKWDPQTVTRSYPRGQEPHRYSRMYPPPPGEQ